MSVGLLAFRFMILTDGGCNRELKLENDSKKRRHFVYNSINRL